MLIVVVIALSWLPSLGLALGDDHQGRIIGRFVLHAQNFLEDGWSGSDYGAAWLPYSSAPYAHHPPLSHFVQIGGAVVQGSTSAFGARLLWMLGGLATVVSAAALVYRLTRSWFATAFALAGLAISGFYWFFGRNFSVLFPILYFLVRAYAPEKPDWRWLGSMFALGGLAALESWQAALIIGLVALYDLVKRRPEAALSAGLGVVFGTGLTVFWIESAAGVDRLVGHLESRVEAADYGIVDWFARQANFYLRFESIPIFVLTVAGLVQGLRDERFRPLIGATFVSVLLFAFAFYQNAWVHEYWNWRLSFVLALGLGALGAAVPNAWRSGWVRYLLLTVLVVAAVVPLWRLTTGMYDNQYAESSNAGELIATHGLPADQEVALHYGGIPAPRWYSWYTGLPQDSFDPEADFDPDDLVLVKRKWRDGLGDLDVVAAMDPYYLVEAGDLERAIRSGDG